MKNMIEITRFEKEAIRKNCPGAHIVRTMKQRSGRGHYFCEESMGVMYLLRKLRKEDDIGRI